MRTTPQDAITAIASQAALGRAILDAVKESGLMKPRRRTRRAAATKRKRAAKAPRAPRQPRAKRVSPANGGAAWDTTDQAAL